MRPADLFKPDFERFEGEASNRHRYACRLRDEKFEELRLELDGDVTALLKKILGLMADREDKKAAILEKALVTRDEHDIDEALMVLHPNVASSKIA